MTLYSREEELLILKTAASTYLEAAKQMRIDDYQTQLIKRLLYAVGIEQAKVEDLNNQIMTLKGK